MAAVPGALWLDAQTLGVTSALVGGRNRASIVPIDGRPARIVGEDSTYLLPILKGKYVLSSPSQASGEARIVPVEDSTIDWSQARTVSSGFVTNAAFGPDQSFGLLNIGQSQLLRIDLPSGHREKLLHALPGLDISSTFSVSRDGRQIVYNDSKRKGNLVMIENMR